MSTCLYRDYILADDGPHGDLNRQVWAGTPWVVDVFTGRISPPDNERDYAIRHWLHDKMGEPSRPFGDEPKYGRWWRGGATVHGWTWFGFATEADMQTFLAAWPNPEESGPKQGDGA